MTEYYDVPISKSLVVVSTGWSYGGEEEWAGLRLFVRTETDSVLSVASNRSRII